MSMILNEKKNEITMVLPWNGITVTFPATEENVRFWATEFQTGLKAAQRKHRREVKARRKASKRRKEAQRA
jgi:hypothetical protein